jgi:hypothetical protein
MEMKSESVYPSYPACMYISLSWLDEKPGCWDKLITGSGFMDGKSKTF